MWQKLLLCSFIPSMLFAGFTGFPLADTYENDDWETINSACHPVSQIYSAIVERVNIVDNGSGAIGAVAMVATYTCGAGSNISVVVDSVNTNISYTNFTFAVTNITKTNQFAPFTYTYTDYSGSHTETAEPYLTAAGWAHLCAKLDAIIPYFISDQFSLSAGGLNDYLADKSLTNGLAVLPIDNKTELLTDLMIGKVQSTTTNRYGWITGGTSHYTGQTESRFGAVMIETAYYGTNTIYGNNWMLGMTDGSSSSEQMFMYPHHIGGYSSSDGYWWQENSFIPVAEWQSSGGGYTIVQGYIKDLYKPIIHYQPAGTNPFASVDVTIYGEYITNVWQAFGTAIPATETVTMSTTNFALDKTWTVISNIVISTPAPNTNDTYTILYTNDVQSYADVPYYISIAQLDEKYKVLKRLTRTVYGNRAFGQNNNPNVSATSIGRQFDYDGSILSDEEDWADAKSVASGEMENSAYWVTITNQDLYPRISIEGSLSPGTPDTYIVSLFAGNVDSKQICTNIYSGCEKTFAYYAGDYTYPDYFTQFSGNMTQPMILFAEYYSASTDTNNYAIADIQSWVNPVSYLPASPPTATNSYVLTQYWSAWFMVFDWSSGLEYK